MLIKCPDCGKRVSDLAEHCPRCGRMILGHVDACEIERQREAERHMREHRDQLKKKASKFGCGALILAAIAAGFCFSDEQMRARLLGVVIFCAIVFVVKVGFVALTRRAEAQESSASWRSISGERSSSVSPPPASPPSSSHDISDVYSEEDAAAYYESRHKEP